MAPGSMITIDVGVRHWANARWGGETLALAQYVDLVPLEQGAYHLRDLIENTRPERVVIEIPKVYDAQFQKGDQRDIRDLALAAGALITAANFAPMHQLGDRRVVEYFEPREWKGTVDKKVMLARIYDRLTLEERACIRLTEKVIDAGIRSGKGPGADVLDAIGIGLWKLGRLNKGRTR